MLEYIVAAGLICLGLVFCFFGYGLFKISLSVFGFIFGFGFGEMAYLVFSPSGSGTFWYYFCAMFCGFIFAFLSFSLYKLGIVLLGISVTASVMASIHYILFGNVEVTFVYTLIMVVLGVLGGVLALKLRQPLIIAYTSLGGGCLVAKALTYAFNQNFFFTVNATIAGVIALVLAALGFLVQMRSAARKKKRKMAYEKV